MHEQKFWLDDPCCLFSDFELLPRKDMTTNEKLNALTRLVIIIAVVMYVMNYEYWFNFLVISLLIIIVSRYLYKNSRKEGFSMNPTYTEGSAPFTTVPPLFAEELQLPPPSYDEYTWTGVSSPQSDLACASQECLTQYPYPIYNQYITDTTVLPSEEEEIRNRPLKDVQIYMTDAFTRDSMDFRNNMTRLFVNRLNREYRHGCFDQITPYSSW